MKRKPLLTSLMLFCLLIFVLTHSQDKENQTITSNDSMSSLVGTELGSKRIGASMVTQMASGMTYAWGAPMFTYQDKKGGYVDRSYLATPFNSEYTVARSQDNMVLVPGGNIEINSGVDPVWGDSIPQKLVAISPFWMDETEITNRQYREFVYYVRDSIIRERLADPDLGNDSDYKIILKDKETDEIIFQTINWTKKIPWKKPKANQAAAIISVLSGAPFAEGLRTSLLDYKYDWFDDKSYYAALIEMRDKGVDVVTISKDTAYFDQRGNVVRETLIRASTGELVDFTNTYIVNVYPDVYSWMTDFANAKNEQYMKNYFVAPGFDNFPVVGVSWDQADAFCAWRTDILQRHLKPKDLIGYEPYRLPTEAEWTFAARNGLSDMKYPWMSSKATTSEGLALANFRGSIDLKDLVTPVATYYPNLFGLYDMAGNVAEWTSTAYSESVDLMTDIVNPDYSYRAVASDPDILKRKVVKGGSWKDTETFTRSDIRSVEYQNRGRSYIGFRCVRSWGLDKDGQMILK